jgi:hypothetical protein
MVRKLLVALCLLASLASPALAQAPQAQPLTVYYDYTIVAGKEAGFMDLVKTVGQPVRDRLMSEGVVTAWGLDVPVLRYPGGATHSVWFSVPDMAGVQKVVEAMAAQQEKLAADEAARKAPRGTTTAERGREIIDGSKTHDYITRDLVWGLTPTLPPAGTLPYTRYNFIKVHPGKGGDYRAAWEKYRKPVYDKLVADGSILGYGLAVEDVKTSGDFTHFVWIVAKDLAGLEKTRAAFAADGQRRSQEERDAINALFTGLTDSDAARSSIWRATIFKVAGQK